MPVLGNPSWIPEPGSWQSVSALEVQNIIVGLAIEAERTHRDSVDSRLLVAAEAIVAAAQFQEVFISEGESEWWFATGPRFVPEVDLYYSLDELLEIASGDALIDSPVEFDPLDTEVQTALREGLGGAGLLQLTEDGERFDSFADRRHFLDVFISVIEDWERGLADRVVSNDVRLEITVGLIPDQAAAICQQITAFNEDDLTPDELSDLVTNLTPSVAYEFARGFRLMAFSREAPLETLLQRLEALARRYNL